MGRKSKKQKLKEEKKLQYQKDIYEFINEKIIKFEDGIRNRLIELKNRIYETDYTVDFKNPYLIFQLGLVERQMDEYKQQNYLILREFNGYSSTMMYLARSIDFNKYTDNEDIMLLLINIFPDIFDKTIDINKITSEVVLKYAVFKLGVSLFDRLDEERQTLDLQKFIVSNWSTSYLEKKNNDFSSWFGPSYADPAEEPLQNIKYIKKPDRYVIEYCLRGLPKGKLPEPSQECKYSKKLRNSYKNLGQILLNKNILHKREKERVEKIIEYINTCESMATLYRELNDN